MKYLTKNRTLQRDNFTKPSGFTSARSPRNVFYTNFILYFPMQFFLPSKNPHRKIATGISDFTDHITDQSAVNGINATLRARLIAVVSSR